MTIINIDFSQEITKNDLLDALKDEAKQISIHDFIKTCSYLRKNMEHVHPHFQEEYIKMYTEGYLAGFIDIKKDNHHYNGTVDGSEIKESILLLIKQEKMMITEFGEDKRSFRPYMIMSLYKTYILDEPIHPVGTPFPGGLKVRKENRTYYCPVKDNNEDNPMAVCGFCIAEQEPNM